MKDENKEKTVVPVEPVIDEAPPMTEALPPETADLPPVEAAVPPEQSAAQQELISVLKRFYPEVQVEENPDSVMEALLPFVQSIVQFHDDLNEVVEEFPEFGDFIIGLRQGMSPQEAIATFFDPETLTPPDDAPDAEVYKKAKAGRRKKIGDTKARAEKVKGNSIITETNLDEAAVELGLDDATKNNVGMLMVELIRDATQDGIITKENWIKAINGTRHESVVAEKDKQNDDAFEDGKVAGRNEKIGKKRKSRDTGDTLPKLTNSGTPSKTEQKDKFTTGLEKLADRKSIL